MPLSVIVDRSVSMMEPLAPIYNNTITKGSFTRQIKECDFSGSCVLNLKFSREECVKFAGMNSKQIVLQHCSSKLHSQALQVNLKIIDIESDC